MQVREDKIHKQANGHFRRYGSCVKIMENGVDVCPDHPAAKAYLVWLEREGD